MFRFTQLLQSLTQTGNRNAGVRISQLEESSTKELTTVRLRPETKAYLQSQSETLGVSLSQVINMILDGVVSMEMKPEAENKIKGIYDKIMSLFELHNINTIDMVKMLSVYGIKLSQIRNSDKFIDSLSMDMIKDIASWFSIDYRWITGESDQLYSPRDNSWYKDSYDFCLMLLTKSFSYPDLKISVVKGDNVSFENAEKFEDQYTRLYVGFILNYTYSVNGVSFVKYEVCEFQRWNYVKCRGYIRFILYFLESVRGRIKSQGVSFGDETIDGIITGKLLPATIQRGVSETWFITELVGDIRNNYDIEQNPSEYLDKFYRLIRMIRSRSPVTISKTEYATKDFSYGWSIHYIVNGEMYESFYHSLSDGLDDIYDKHMIGKV